MKKEMDYWEVEIKCLVRKEGVNKNKVPISRVKDDLSINFDQIDYEDLEINVK